MASLSPRLLYPASPSSPKELASRFAGSSFSSFNTLSKPNLASSPLVYPGCSSPSYAHALKNSHRPLSKPFPPSVSVQRFTSLSPLSPFHPQPQFISPSCSGTRLAARNGLGLMVRESQSSSPPGLEDLSMVLAVGDASKFVVPPCDKRNMEDDSGMIGGSSVLLLENSTSEDGGVAILKESFPVVAPLSGDCPVVLAGEEGTLLNFESYPTGGKAMECSLTQQKDNVLSTLYAATVGYLPILLPTLGALNEPSTLCTLSNFELDSMGGKEKKCSLTLNKDNVPYTLPAAPSAQKDGTTPIASICCPSTFVAAVADLLPNIVPCLNSINTPLHKASSSGTTSRPNPAAPAVTKT